LKEWCDVLSRNGNEGGKIDFWWGLDIGNVVYFAQNGEGSGGSADMNEGILCITRLWTQDLLEADGDEADETTHDNNEKAESDLFSPSLLDGLVFHTTDRLEEEAWSPPSDDTRKYFPCG